MTFPNAFEGVKKIFKAEILQIIAIAALLVATIAAIVTVGAAAEGEDLAAGASLGIAGILGIGAAVLMIIAFIMNIKGLNLGSKDEPLFKTALTFVLVGIIASVVSGAAASVAVLKNIADIVSFIAGLCVTYYVVKAIMSLAEKLGDTAVFEKGKSIIKLIFAIYILSLIADILGTFALTGTAGGIVAIIGSALSLIQYIIYLTYLSDAKKMLAR